MLSPHGWGHTGVLGQIFETGMNTCHSTLSVFFSTRHLNMPIQDDWCVVIAAKAKGKTVLNEVKE